LWIRGKPKTYFCWLFCRFTYGRTFANIGTYFWTWTTFVSYSNLQIVFNNEIGHDNSCPVNLKYRSEEQMLLSQWRIFVFMCFSQHMSLSISFTLMSTTTFPRKYLHIQSMVESLKPSLDICYTIWNQILYYMRQLHWTLRIFFADSSASHAVECSRSIRISIFSEPVLFRQLYYVYWNFPIRRCWCWRENNGGEHESVIWRLEARLSRSKRETWHVCLNMWSDLIIS
jgi:hypothetical protein